MNARSYFALLRAAPGSVLLGGVLSHISSRFESESDANAWLAQARKANEQSGRTVAFACVYASEKRAEIPCSIQRPTLCISCGHAEAYGGTAGGCPCTAEDKQRAVRALARLACPEGVKP